MRVIECEQRSKEWWDVRRGVPSASEFHKILTPTTGKPAASQDKYIHKLIAEKYANEWPQDSLYVSQALQHGIDTEDQARDWYSFLKDTDVRQVGFCLEDNGRYGCSPDGLVGEDGSLELKCPSLETHAGYLLNGELPIEYKVQVHGQLVVTGRKWVDFMSYAHGLPALIVRVVPDAYTDMLRVELEKFCNRYAEAIEKIRSLQQEQ